MTLRQFNKLDEIEQAEAIWEKGVFLSERTAGGYRYCLYQIDSFYVEFHYHIELNMLKRARVFANPDHLEPYLDQMSFNYSNIFI